MRCLVGTALVVHVASCALPGIHREDAAQLAEPAELDAAVSASPASDPLQDPANFNEDYETFKSLVPREHVFAEWPMPDTSEDAKAKPSYTLSDDVVTDNVTKLRWQRQPPDVYPGCKAEYEFVGRKRGQGSGCSWEEAKAYCKRPELAEALGGGTWRLPTKIELESLIEVSRINTIHPSFNIFPIDFVWSSSPYPNPIPDGKKLSWNIDFMEGLTNVGARYRGGRVICVSSPSAADGGGTTQDFQIVGGVAHDKHTSLTWQRVPDSAPRTWQEAIEYCQQLELDGGGWHLPSLKELLTIVDSSLHEPALNRGTFPFVQNARFWSGSDFLDGRERAYQVDFEKGGSWTEGDYSDKHFVRCAR
jgi:hypothetical protein